MMWCSCAFGVVICSILISYAHIAECNALRSLILTDFYAYIKPGNAVYERRAKRRRQQPTRAPTTDVSDNNRRERQQPPSCCGCSSVAEAGRIEVRERSERKDHKVERASEANARNFCRSAAERKQAPSLGVVVGRPLEPPYCRRGGRSVHVLGDWPHMPPHPPQRKPFAPGPQTRARGGGALAS